MEKEGSKHLIRLGFSFGDANGIGPEVMLKALMDSRILQDCTPIIFGSLKTISQIKKTCEITEFNFIQIKHPSEAHSKKINVINYPDDEHFSRDLSSKLAIWSLEEAALALENNDLDALVTAPISKESMQVSGFDFPGHTEFLEKRFAEKGALMVLCNDNLKVALATNHIALKDVPGALNKELILSKITLLNQSLIKDFGIQRPKIAVLGLNPHSGENGKIGIEELEIIQPAISAAKSQNILAFGPYSSDGYFGSKECFEFDAVLSMYHDQGLTGFKAIAFEEGVNFTAGLNIVRTSPGHGTAFNLVDKNSANEQSMRNAIYLALDTIKSRRVFLESKKDFLHISKGQKESDLGS